LPFEVASEPQHPPEVERIDGAERMSVALASLSAKEREAVVLFELEGFTLEEIASMEGDSLSAVKSRLARARMRLRRHYEKDAAALDPIILEMTP
jgi:RNA polymerase sigma-70 factor (ECF subfamily)